MELGFYEPNSYKRIRFKDFVYLINKFYRSYRGFNIIITVEYYVILL